MAIGSVYICTVSFDMLAHKQEIKFEIFMKWILATHLTQKDQLMWGHMVII